MLFPDPGPAYGGFAVFTLVQFWKWLKERPHPSWQKKVDNTYLPE